MSLSLPFVWGDKAITWIVGRRGAFDHHPHRVNSPRPCGALKPPSLP